MSDPTTQQVADALVRAQGDLLEAARDLAIPVKRLDHMILHVGELQVCLGIIAEVKLENQDELNAKRLKESQLLMEREYERRSLLYRVAGVQALYDVATMDVDTGNAALMQVKVNAARELRPHVREPSAIATMDAFFRELDREYRELSPRIKVARAVLIEVETGGRDPGREPDPQSALVIESESRREPEAQPQSNATSE